MPLRLAIPLAALVLASALAAPAAAGTCANVDVGLPVTEPVEHCFRLDMTCAPGLRYGCFKAPLQLKEGFVAGAGGRKLRELAAPFGYIDPDGVHWDVPAGFQTDGASIPLFFQPLIGGPWTENYVNAAVIHDYYIRRRSVRAEAVHKVFYIALLAADTGSRRAQQMYFAVGNFGPQWKSIDLDAYRQSWQAHKAMLEAVTKWHQDVWEAFQRSEQQRREQAAIDRAVLGRPLPDRTRVFKLGDQAATPDGLETFIAANVADHILDPDRDVTLIKLLREQVETELRRPAPERDNIFVVMFTKLGPTTVRFAARTDADLKALLDQNEAFIRAEEAIPELPPAICVGECARPR